MGRKLMSQYILERGSHLNSVAQEKLNRLIEKTTKPEISMTINKTHDKDGISISWEIMDYWDNQQINWEKMESSVLIHTSKNINSR